MHEIGDLWHRNVITVDKEHYATSVNQTVMSGFFDEIFERPRKNRTLVAGAVGSELHEMGIRMLSDIFEYQGWDTFYLGAALPEQAVLEAIGEHKPDLVASRDNAPLPCRLRRSGEGHQGSSSRGENRGRRPGFRYNGRTVEKMGYRFLFTFGRRAHQLGTQHLCRITGPERKPVWTQAGRPFVQV